MDLTWNVLGKQAGGEKMAQKGTEGIQIISEQAVNVSLGTLASRTALLLLDDHASALNEPFLMKKVRITAHLTGLTAGQGLRISIGLARGGASVTQIKSALEDNLFERNKKGQAAKRDVLSESLTEVTIENFDGTICNFDSGMISLGGGKGIPFDEDIGWQWFIWNKSASGMTTGSVFALIATYWGIWL